MLTSSAALSTEFVAVTAQRSVALGAKVLVPGHSIVKSPAKPTDGGVVSGTLTTSELLLEQPPKITVEFNVKILLHPPPVRTFTIVALFGPTIEPFPVTLQLYASPGVLV